MITAPASRRFFVSVASYGGTSPTNASAPPVVGMSVVWMLSLSAIGMPCSGPRTRPCARSRSSASASVERLRVHGDRGVQRVLVGRDARQVLLHDLVRGRPPGLHRRLHVGDAGLEDVERRRAGLRRARRGRLAAGDEEEREERGRELHAQKG